MIFRMIFRTKGSAAGVPSWGLCSGEWKLSVTRATRRQSFEGYSEDSYGACTSLRPGGVQVELSNSEHTNKGTRSHLQAAGCIRVELCNALVTECTRVSELPLGTRCRGFAQSMRIRRTKGVSLAVWEVIFGTLYVCMIEGRI